MILYLYFTTNNGVYDTQAKNIIPDKDTVTLLRFVTYQLYDAKTDEQRGILKLSITSTPSHQNNPNSPSLNTYIFTFYLTSDDLVVTTEYSFIAEKTTPFPSFKNRILSITPLYCTHGTVHIQVTQDNRKNVTIRL
jgi:hypothetical protein